MRRPARRREPHDQCEQCAGTQREKRQAAQSLLVFFGVVHEDVARAAILADRHVSFATAEVDLMVVDRQRQDLGGQPCGWRRCAVDPVELHGGGVGKCRSRRGLPDSHTVGDLLGEDLVDERFFGLVEYCEHRQRLCQDHEERQRAQRQCDAQAYARPASSG